MNDFKYFMKDSVHDLFSYLKSPHFDYKDYRHNNQSGYCNDLDVDDYNNFEFYLYEFFSNNTPIETRIENIRNEYFRNKENDHYEDFRKEINIHNFNKLKLQSTILDVLFDDDNKINIDSHFVSRYLKPNLNFNNSIHSIKETLTILIKLILSIKLSNQ